MKRILFVDDEPNVLAGLRRMLRGLRQQWEMEFVEGGPKALRRMDETPFDVVVTDMRMPGMDGSQLLREVLQAHPGTVRIVLSGQCGRDVVLQAVGPAHQFLTKPCDAETVRGSVARACRLRDQLLDERYRQLVSRIRSLGTRPAVYEALAAELRGPQPSIDRLGELLGRDAGASIRVLQLVNSGFFGSPRRIVSPAEAARLLGLEVLRPLVFDVEAIVPLAIDGALEAALGTLADHGLAVADAARRLALAETGSRPLADDAYLGGLLHDVGITVLAQESPERCAELLCAARRDGALLWETEKRYFSATHAELGAYLAALWGLPDSVVECIALHHYPSLSLDATFTDLTAVHVANAALTEPSGGSPGPASPLDVDYLKRIGCEHRLDEWIPLCGAAAPEGALP